MIIIPRNRYMGFQFMAGDGSCPCIITKYNEGRYFIKWHHPDTGILVGELWQPEIQVQKQFECGYFKKL